MRRILWRDLLSWDVAIEHLPEKLFGLALVVETHRVENHLFTSSHLIPFRSATATKRKAHVAHMARHFARIKLFKTFAEPL
jgi:hypothetical protein